MASVGFLSVLITAATVLTTLTIVALLALVLWDWRRGTLW